jgi:hypothetical protein
MGRLEKGIQNFLVFEMLPGGNDKEGPSDGKETRIKSDTPVQFIHAVYPSRHVSYPKQAHGQREQCDNYSKHEWTTFVIKEP